MPPIRVLVVDDAVVVRRIVTEALSADPGIEVVGTAPNGRLALHKLPHLNPDIVTLDVEMPEMDGLETLTQLRREYPDLPVVMFSTLTERGASVTMEALLRGANDYVTKPANVGSVSEARQQVREQLLPRIHALCGRAEVTAAVRPPSRRPPVDGPGRRIEAVVVGVSTGGPNALAEVLPALPADLGVPVLVVQHMPPTFTRLLAERLDGHTPLDVREARHGEPITTRTVLIAPGDHHLEARRTGARRHAALTTAPPENSCRPSVDVLFRSAVEAFGGGVLGVVLTGMGSDGARGARAITEAGGRVIVQDQATSVVWGMPGAVVAAGLAADVRPVSGIAPAIVERVRSGSRHVVVPSS